MRGMVGKIGYVTVAVVLASVSQLAAKDKDSKKEDGSFSVLDSVHGRASSRESSKPINPLKVKWLRLQEEMGHYSWDAKEGVPVSKIEVHIDEQKIYVFQNDKKVAEGHVSTGKDGHDTPPGNYKVQVKELHHESNLYGEFISDSTGKVVDWDAQPGDTPPPGAHYIASPMPFFLRLTGDGTGLHAGYLPGKRDSHGCIRLNEKFAEKLFGVVEVGTPVFVIGAKAEQVAEPAKKKDD